MLSKIITSVLPATFLLLKGVSAKSEYSCPEHLYNVQVFSQDPLVIYIPDFITVEEAEHLQKITSGKFSRSIIADEHGHQRDATTRTSRSTSLASDPVVACIENRALAFQGYDLPRTHLEPLQLVHYELGEKYHTHTDWFEASSQTTAEFGGNRQSSFFVYIAASDIIGGGTNFPLLNAPKDERWCEYVNCDEEWDAGVTFRPIPRNAVYWRNLHNDGRGNRATLHAGLPVTNGTKLGMNIWTRQKPLHAQYRSDHFEL